MRDHRHTRGRGAVRSQAACPQLARWAGDDPAAVELASRGASLMGASRWLRAYAAEPEAWLAQLGCGPELARWRRHFGGLGHVERRLVHCVAASPTGLSLSTLVACWRHPCASAVAELVAAHWLRWVDNDRVEVPGVRRDLLSVWTAERDAAAARQTLRRYTARRLASPERWTPDDTACLAACLRASDLATALDDDALLTAVSLLRRTPHATVAIDALRQRLAGVACHEGGLSVRRTLGAALIESGAFRESLLLLDDGSRASTVMRAHALLRSGEAHQGQRLLQALGPAKDDLNWVLQWALSATRAEDTGGADAALETALATAREARHRGLIWARLAELAEARSAESLPHYERAVADLGAAGDALGQTYCQARYARALVRCGRRDDAADAATAAWRAAIDLPNSVLRGTAALACVESGAAAPETLVTALRAAARSEDPELAEDALRVLNPDGTAPILSLGNGHACLDGQPLTLTPSGPPWRLLDFLCRLPPGSVVSVAELFEAGWPSDRAHPDSRRRRVHTAIWTLRRAGLRDVIQTVDRNRYRLHAQVIAPVR